MILTQGNLGNVNFIGRKRPNELCLLYIILMEKDREFSTSNKDRF